MPDEGVVQQYDKIHFVTFLAGVPRKRQFQFLFEIGEYGVSRHFAYNLSA